MRLEFLVGRVINFNLLQNTSEVSIRTILAAHLCSYTWQ